MTNQEHSSRTRRTVLTVTLAATAGLVGGMALKTVTPSNATTTRLTNTGAGAGAGAGNAPSAADQDSTGVWVQPGDGGWEGVDDDGPRTFAPAIPPQDLGAPRGGPAMSSHGS